MFRIAICDDERCFAETIEHYVRNYLSEDISSFEIDTFASGKDLIALGMDLIRYKIIFLDINMKEIDGIKTAQKIREYSSDVFIVFVTAHFEYSLEGYKVNAERYILKNNVNLEDSIYECLDVIFEKINHIVLKKKIVFHECEKDVFLDRIVYIESKLHKLEFHILEDRVMTYTMHGPLNVWEKDLYETGFFRIHQSYLVNLRHVKRVEGYRVILSNDLTLPVPKARYREVKNAFIAFIGDL